MGVNNLPKTVTGQRRDCDLNPGPSAPESSALTTRLPSHLSKRSRGGRLLLRHGSLLQRPSPFFHLPSISTPAISVNPRSMRRVTTT